MRAKIEKWLLCLLLAAGYLQKAPGLLAQGGVGVLPLVLGGVVYAGLIVLLARERRGAALFVGVLAAVSVALQGLGYLLAAPAARPAALEFGAGLGIALVGAWLGLDLWAQWRRAAQQAAAGAPPVR